MRMNGRRESGNIDDRRGQGSSGFGGSGGGLNNLALLFSLFSLFRKSKGSNGSNQKGGCGCLGIIVVLVIGYFVIKMMGSGGLDLGSVLNSGLVSSGSQSAYTIPKRNTSLRKKKRHLPPSQSRYLPVQKMYGQRYLHRMGSPMNVRVWCYTTTAHHRDVELPIHRQDLSTVRQTRAYILTCRSL